MITCLATGELLPVKDTPFDFNEMKKIGQDIEEDHIQLKNAFGYDHSFVLKGDERQLTLEEPDFWQKTCYLNDRSCCAGLHW